MNWKTKLFPKASWEVWFGPRCREVRREQAARQVLAYCGRLWGEPQGGRAQRGLWGREGGRELAATWVALRDGEVRRLEVMVG